MCCRPTRRLQQARSELEDLRSRIVYEIAHGISRLNAASRQLELRPSALALARQQVGSRGTVCAYGVTITMLKDLRRSKLRTQHRRRITIAGVVLCTIVEASLARSFGIAEDADEKFLGGK